MLITLLVLLFALVFGRQVGWLLSRRVLYHAPALITVVLCLGWGCLIAYLLHDLILWRNMGIVIKVIAYGEGSYLSFPNYGLIQESTIPDEVLPRHFMIKAVPFLTFVAASFGFAFLLK
jgi:hypothetical protein